MITVLVGQCCSGKDSIARELIKNYGYKRVVSNTTRPMRTGEKEGVDYYFWDELPFNRDVVSLKEYHTAQGTWYYWFEVDDIKEAGESDENYIAIADVDGAMFFEEYGAKIIYISSDFRLRFKRYYNRVSRDENPDYKEMARRLLVDLDAFEKFEYDAMVKHRYSWVINQDKPLSSVVNEVNDLIKGIQ